MSSQIVYIQRVNTSRADLLYPDAKKKIGAVLTPSGDVATGLTLEEEKKIMPTIVHTDPSDYNFKLHVQNFFKTLTLNIPPSYGLPDDGLHLEIGLENGIPISPIDYVKYKFAMVNPTVIVDEGRVRPGVTKYIIADPKRKLEQDVKHLDSRKKAYKEYIKLCDNEKKLNAVCSILGIELGITQPKKTPKEVKELKLENFVKENPDRFMSVVMDQAVETRAFIEDLVTYGVIKRIGTAIINGNETIGNTTDEAVIYLQDKANSDVYITFKAKLDEFNKTI